jgi:hypothetical protein
MLLLKDETRKMLLLKDETRKEFEQNCGVWTKKKIVNLLK